jgi:hypothetical protein
LVRCGRILSTDVNRPGHYLSRPTNARVVFLAG